MTRVLIAIFILLASVKAMAETSVQQARTYAALFRLMDEKFNSNEKPCELFVQGFSEKFASSKVSKEPAYSKMREIGAAEIEKLTAPDVQAGDELVVGIPDTKIDADTAAKLNEARREGRVHIENFRATPVNEQTCRNFLRIFP